MLCQVNYKANYQTTYINSVGKALDGLAPSPSNGNALPFASKSAYNSLVQTCFDCCCELWDPIGNTLSTKLQSLQNRAARFIMGYSNDMVSQMLPWLSLERRLQFKSRLVYKITQCFRPYSAYRIIFIYITHQ